MNHYSRRRALKMIGLVAVATASGHLLPLPRLSAAQPQAPLTGLDDFLHVSRLLTQQDDLSPALAHALMLALTQTHTAFARDLTTLSALLQNQPGLLLQDRLTFASEESASEALAKAILGGWYTGVVGKGKAALYVTYVNTLSNQLVRDKVVPPGFAYGPVGSWAKQP
ncbi:sugar dehydrogenase complex small subunit [Pantoea sp. NSTU24]|uniref:sugar dehydrogenase complex small subunit n=1 Tax=Pantoea sp. NSTU24 TaxID=3391144 RepID=UPI003CFFA5E7